MNFVDTPFGSSKPLVTVSRVSLRGVSITQKNRPLVDEEKAARQSTVGSPARSPKAHVSCQKVFEMIALSCGKVRVFAFVILKALAFSMIIAHL